jgi:hypothetical protein
MGGAFLSRVEKFKRRPVAADARSPKPTPAPSPRSDPVNARLTVRACSARAVGSPAQASGSVRQEAT